jgi:hypothetical protein
MFYKLNSEPATEALTEGCDVGKETSENQTKVNIEGKGGLIEQVANYKKVMTEDFGISENVFFETIPVNMGHILSFISKNWEDLAGTRIYFTKKTDDPGLDDYELLFVPCKAVKDKRGDVAFYEDKLVNRNGTPTHIISIKCRKPPNCTKGAHLLPHP